LPGGQHPDHRPDQVLRGLILDAARVVKADPRAEGQYRALDRTYLHPAPSQEKAAELLDLPFSTYRRYRDRGVDAITEWLWDRDIEDCRVQVGVLVRQDISHCDDLWPITGSLLVQKLRAHSADGIDSHFQSMTDCIPD
jgi:hypothetical protein